MLHFSVDATFAVFFPALILFYSLSVFQDDLMAVKIRQRFFPPRVFERKARNFVSAKELNMFSTDFESLLIQSVWDIFLKLSFSLLACFRWSKITHLLLQREHKGQGTQPKGTGEGPTGALQMNCKAVAPLDPTAGTSTRRKETPKARGSSRSRCRTVVGLFFLIYGVGCIVYTVISVRMATASCLPYPTCVQFAYQWVPGGSNDECDCLAYVERDMAPADADNLTDVTQTLARLASAGKLQTVQLINRRVNGSLPQELQSCDGLRNLYVAL
jgi:hypothetical protein